MPLLPLPISFVSEHLMIFSIWRLKTLQQNATILDRELKHELQQPKCTSVRMLVLLNCWGASCPGSGLNQLALLQSLGTAWELYGHSQLEPLDLDARVQLMACLIPY